MRFNNLSFAGVSFQGNQERASDKLPAERQAFTGWSIREFLLVPVMMAAIPHASD